MALALWGNWVPQWTDLGKCRSADHLLTYPPQDPFLVSPNLRQIGVPKGFILRLHEGLLQPGWDRVGSCRLLEIPTTLQLHETNFCINIHMKPISACFGVLIELEKWPNQSLGMCPVSC